MEVADLSLITYVIKIKPHTKACERSDIKIHPDQTYYYAIEREKNFAITHYGKSIRITTELMFAEIFDSGADAGKVGKDLTIRELTLASVHPVSRKVFFEASLKGLR